MCPLRLLPSPCQACQTLVVEAELLVAVVPAPVFAPGGPVHVELTAAPVAQDLALHCGMSLATGRWLVAPLDEPSTFDFAQRLSWAHAHRVHVCAAVPSAWTAENPVAAAASSSYSRVDPAVVRR